MKPRADFVCLSKDCEKKGKPSVYELPVLSKICPVCGKKKLRQLPAIRVNTGRKPDHFDGRHTSSSMAQRVDALVQQPIESSLSKRDELKRSGQRWRNDNGMVRTVPLRSLPEALKQTYAGQPIAVPETRVARDGTREERLAAAQGGSLPPTVDPLVGAPIPREVVARDTQFKIVKGADGLPEASSA